MTDLRVPWEFSEAPKPGEQGVPNLPSEEGARAGLELAKVAERGRAVAESRGLACGKRCDECAFTAGTIPNQSLDTLGDAIKCVVESVPFMCHKGTDPGSRLCGGWLDAITHPAVSS